MIPLAVEGVISMPPRITRFEAAKNKKFQQVIEILMPFFGINRIQDTATLDLTGKELANDVCFDTCKEYPNCGGVYLKVHIERECR